MTYSIIPISERFIEVYCAAVDSVSKERKYLSFLEGPSFNQAKAIGFTGIELTVREENKAAITLYQKFGFVIEGIKHKAVRMDGKYENVVCMALLFE
jgi:RimJ/RimL family protein N-acetyltransferase